MYKLEDSKIHNDLRILIKLMKFQDPDRKLALYEQFALHTIKNHRFLSVDSHAVGRSMNGLIEKFNIHGHKAASEKLHNLYKEFINHSYFQDHIQCDLKWSLLSLLIHISWNPTGSLHKNYSHPKLAISTSSKKKEPIINWNNILSEDLNLRSDYDSESLSDWTDSDSENVESCENLSNTSVNLQLCSKTKKNNSKHFLEECKSEDTETQTANWLLVEKLQPPWWETGMSYESQSTHTAANLASNWNDYVKSLSYGLIEPENISTISEYCILRELIWLINVPQTPNNCRIFFRDENNNFKVYSNVTIPSLPPECFQRLLQPFCDSLSKLFTLDSFLDAVIDVNKKRAPFTYKAYREAIIKILQPIKDFVIQLEEHVKSQDDIFTLFTLKTSLQPHLNKIHMVYAIHKDCILDWQNVPASMCVVNLLTKLYNNCHVADSDIATLSFMLFMNSMKVYLNIITMWLNAGRLEDWREEFSIASESSVDQLQDYYLRNDSLKHSLYKQNNIFKILLKKVLSAGQSIHIIQQLGHMGDIFRNTRLKENLFKTFSNEIFQILPQISKLPLPVHIENYSGLVNNKYCKHNLSFVPVIQNSLLKEVFGKYVSPPHPDNIAFEENFVDIYDRILLAPNLSLETVLDKVLNNILAENCAETCKLVVTILKENFELKMHLDALQNIMLMHSGSVMYNFYIQLFKEMDKGNNWSTPFYMTSQLEAFLSYSKFSNLVTLFSVYLKNPINCSNKLQILSNLKISYIIKYPLSLVISQRDLEKYEECMQFLLKVNWSMWALQNLSFSSELRRHSYIRSEELISKKLQVLRFWLLHSIGSIHSYLFSQVLNVAKLNLEHKIEIAVAHEDLHMAHKEFIDHVHEHCLLAPKYKSIFKIIQQLLQLVEMMRSEWLYRFENTFDYTDNVNYDDLNDFDQICTMETLYIRCHSFLQDTFKKSLDDDNKLTDLCTAFDCNLPETYGIFM